MQLTLATIGALLAPVPRKSTRNADAAHDARAPQAVRNARSAEARGVVQRASEAARTLHGDTRGAVMLTGLCMSCFLIGSLWFIIGIGDAIVFRDTMQEAADHAAFTSAVLHAKGMNFISACNLIMLALIAIHIIMGIIHDILLAICILAAVYTFGTSCTPWANWRNVYTNYGKIMKKAASAIHLVEIGAAYGYPFIGFVKGYTLGDDYGEFGPKKRDLNVLALSTSMIPGAVLNGPINALFKKKNGGSSALTSKTQKKGLPVEAKPFEAVCKRIAQKGFTELFGLTGQNPPGKVMNFVKNLLADGLAMRYCNPLSNTGGSTSEAALGEHVNTGNGNLASANGGGGGGAGGGGGGGGGGSIDPGFDTWWGDDGPLVPWMATENGGPWQQIWAVNLKPPFKDGSEHRVAMADRYLTVEESAKTSAYMAEAEFYFDCTKDWRNPECNLDDNAGYAIKWRARMRRLQFPEVGSLLASFGGNFLQNIKGYSNFKDLLKSNKLLDKLSKNVMGAIGTTALGTVIDTLFKEIELQMNKALGKAGATLNPEFPGIYH